MTLIAFGTYRDRAEIVTDSASYNLTSQGHMSKVMPMPHLDAAVMEQGSSVFAKLWRYRLLQLDRERVVDFDDLHARSPEELRRAWQAYTDQADEENAEYGSDVQTKKSVIFHVGYSARAGRFMAYAYASDVDFEPEDLSTGHVMPTPLDVRPSRLEAQRLREHLLAYVGDDPQEKQAVHAWLAEMDARPAFVPPTTRKDWVRLAKKVRHDRAMAHIASGLKTKVAGDVVHTTLRVGEVHQRRVHTFDDSGEEFAQVVAGTLHPLGQLAACAWCDSGHPFIDCCLAETLDKPCPCRSGRLFEACCSIHADQPADASPALATV